MRAAMVGGTAYYAGKKVQQGRTHEEEQDAAISDTQQGSDAAPPPAPAAPPAEAPQESVVDQLTKLKSLLDANVLTQDEFDAQKSKILGS
jgi:hypothetical protein